MSMSQEMQGIQAAAAYRNCKNAITEYVEALDKYKNTNYSLEELDDGNLAVNYVLPDEDVSAHVVLKSIDKWQNPMSMEIDLVVKITDEHKIENKLVVFLGATTPLHRRLSFADNLVRKSFNKTRDTIVKNKIEKDVPISRLHKTLNKLLAIGLFGIYLNNGIYALEKRVSIE